MRQLYRTAYKKGRGFTAGDWWPAVSRAAGGRSFAEFTAKYIDGREPFPWSDVLARAGMRMASDTVREPRIGVATAEDSSGAIIVQEVQSGGAAQEAGVQPGDHLLALGDVEIMDPNFGTAFRARFGKNEGDSLPIRVRRGADTLTLHGLVRLDDRVENRLEADPGASTKAARVRHGIFTGAVGR
jgi:predicted metalloprotease with PDZ domain